MKFAIRVNNLANGLAALNLVNVAYSFDGIGYMEDVNAFNPDHPYVLIETSREPFGVEVELLNKYGYLNKELRKTERPRYSGAQE
jgi:hypothetical protein